MVKHRKPDHRSLAENMAGLCHARLVDGTGTGRPHDVVGMETVKDESTGEEKRVHRPARLWTSTLRRTKETAQFIKNFGFIVNGSNSPYIAGFAMLRAVQWSIK